MINPNELEELIATFFEDKTLFQAVLSSPNKSDESSKIVIRAVKIKEKHLYQVTEHTKQKAIHHNLSNNECLDYVRRHIYHFRQTFFYTKSANYHLLIGKKGNLTLLKKPPTMSEYKIEHNREKEYLLQEGTPIPFLVHMGVMSSEGKVYSAKRNKFRQINRFLEMIDDIIPYLDLTKTIRIVDFGCGKAYLTFALYHFLKWNKGLRIRLVGIDLKEDVIQQCQELSTQLGYDKDLQFLVEDINEYHTQEEVDMVVSLHACDTATDAAIEKAVLWGSKVILSVPCCQHELFSQIKQEALKPLLKHGILRERLTALTTDAARAQLLEVLGYQTQILEFIEVEHTPKNVLIRAVKKGQTKEHQKAAWLAYLKFKQHLTIYPSLEKRFEGIFRTIAER